MTLGNPGLSETDLRLAALTEWLARQFFGANTFTLTPASTDASFRRYFRINAQGRTWIAMDAPPPQENCEPFVRVAALMRAAGLHVPMVVEQDLSNGFLLLSDLGTTTYL